MTNLKNRLETQELEIEKANTKFKFSVFEQEKLKKEFEVEKKAWVNEKTSLINRAEKAEAALEEVTGELAGLKHHVSQMVSAIFGKSPCKCVKYLSLSIDHKTGINSPDHVYAGPRSLNLNQDMLIKLKAVYTLVEQLYAESQRALSMVALSNEVPTLLVEVLKKLSVLPQRFNELRRSAARAGAVNALSRAKAWLPELDPADIATDYPSLKEDGTPFEDPEFLACVKEVRPVATLIADEVDLTKY